MHLFSQKHCALVREVNLGRQAKLADNWKTLQATHDPEMHVPSSTQLVTFKVCSFQL